MLNKDNIMYYGDQGPESRPETALFRIMDFDSVDYWYIDFFHGHHLYDVSIPEDILIKIRNHEVILLLNNSHEAFHDCVEPIYDHFVDKMNIPPTQILLLSESAIIKNVIDDFASQRNIDSINVKWLHILELNVHNRLEYVNKPNTLEIKHYDKKFINLNRRWRIHRPIFVGLLKIHDLLDSGYVSFMNRVEGRSWQGVWQHVEILLQNTETLNLLNTHKEQIMEIPDMYLDTSNLEKAMSAIVLKDSLDYFYENSYFSIVSETNFFKLLGDGVFVSEKLFKTIAKMHPFMLITRPHTLPMIRRLGYKTFSGLIDESYDNEEDDEKRLLMIINETKRLSQLQGDALIHFLTEAKHICEHNYNILLNQTEFITDV